MGNCKVERAKLSPGFIPLGVKEYGGVIYIASYNPDTKEEEIGCFPSPERDITGSNKIEGQTGLMDGKFLSTDYKLPTSKINEEYLPEAFLSKIQKLNEQEVLKLNPGDKYITTYKITPVAGDTPITEANFDNFFSFDENEKKLFNVNFYRIDSDNNVIKIEDEVIKSIPHRTTIEEDEYIYFTESSGGALAVEIKLNSIDYFSANVREISRRTDTNKKVRVEAIGSSVSGLTFEGVRVEATVNKETGSEQTTVFHLDKTQSLEEKVSGTIKDLVADDTLDCEVTPYTEYGYLADLKQSFFLKLGQNISGDKVNDVFKWYVNTRSNRLELDFDFKLDTETPFKLFVEFYDIWSNVSTVRTITNPSIYGPMRLTVNLVDEPKTEIFNVYPAGQIGGIPSSNLIVSESNVNKPILIDPTKSDGKLLVRSDNALRKNHFYLVRICGYEESVNGEIITYSKNDVYRGLYTNTAYNEIYDEQSSLSESNPAYIPNFNKIPYPKENIKLSASVISSDPALVFAPTVLTETPTSLPKTEYQGAKELFSFTEKPTGARVILNSKYSATRNYNLKLDRNDEYIYGKLKSGIIDVVSTTGDIPLTSANIEDSNKDILIPMNSSGHINIPNLTSGDTLFKVQLKINTERPVKGDIIASGSTVTPVDITLDTHMHGRDYRDFQTENKRRFSTVMRYLRGKAGAVDLDSVIDDSGVYPFYRNYTINNPNYIKMTTGGRDFGVNKGLPNLGPVDLVDQWHNDSNMKPEEYFYSNSWGSRSYLNLDVNNIEDNYGITFYNKALPFIVIVMINGSGISNMNEQTFNLLSNLYYTKYENTPSSGYYISNASYLGYDLPSESKFSNLKFDITTGWLDQATKKYIFESYIRANSNTVDFSTANLNILIEAAQTRELNKVIEGDESIIEDNNFIPFVDASTNYPDVQFPIVLNDEVVRKATDTEQLRLMSNSQAVYDAKLAEINNVDINAVQKIKVKSTVTGLLNQRYSVFADMFRYNPGTRVIDFIGVANNIYTTGGTTETNNRFSVFKATNYITIT